MPGPPLNSVSDGLNDDSDPKPWTDPESHQPHTVILSKPERMNDSSCSLERTADSFTANTVMMNITSNI